MKQNSLKAYASKPSQSKGRVYSEPKCQFRNDFVRDRDRIIHSTAFRRLEYKTQVFINHEGDLFRNRLTHSLEVAQIARTISRTLGLHEDLTEAICLAHDLGHTPFGHAGQEMLNQCMQNYGGFEHNLQSLRVVDYLEQKYIDFDGLNLCFETREGILKRCNKKTALELGELGQRFIDNKAPSLEAQLANIADEIAYNSHDIDDGLRSGLLSINQLREIDFFNTIYEGIISKAPQAKKRRIRYEVVRKIITSYVHDLTNNSLQNLQLIAPQNSAQVRNHGKYIIAFSAEQKVANQQLKQFLMTNLYRHYKVHRVMYKAKNIVKEMFEAFFADPKLLPKKYQRKIHKHKYSDKQKAKARVIADYIAGMTDRYAILEHEKLYNPKALS